jgi:hypothetical protein
LLIEFVQKLYVFVRTYGDEVPLGRELELNRVRVTVSKQRSTWI